jgi:hypothetical protein
VVSGSQDGRGAKKLFHLGDRAAAVSITLAAEGCNISFRTEDLAGPPRQLSLQWRICWTKALSLAVRRSELPLGGSAGSFYQIMERRIESAGDE